MDSMRGSVPAGASGASAGVEGSRGRVCGGAAVGAGFGRRVGEAGEVGCWCVVASLEWGRKASGGNDVVFVVCESLSAGVLGGGTDAARGRGRRRSGGCAENPESQSPNRATAPWSRWRSAGWLGAGLRDWWVRGGRRFRQVGGVGWVLGGGADAARGSGVGWGPAG
jgi:hypothetical protein